MNERFDFRLDRIAAGLALGLLLAACHGAATVPPTVQNDAPLSAPAVAHASYTIRCVTGTLDSNYPFACDSSGLNSPYGVAVDAHGNVYIADTGNNAVKRVTPQGVVTCVTGTLNSDGSCAGTAFNGPSGVTLDPAGDLYVSDGGSDRVLEVPKPVRSPWHMRAIAQGFDVPALLAADAKGNVFVADADSSAVYRITAKHGVACVGKGTPPSCSGSGFSNPYGVAVDGADNVYVADTGNNEVKKITPRGKLTVLASGFDQPSGVAVDPSCKRRCYVYVTDTDHNQVKQIGPSGRVTVVGNYQYCSGGTCLFQSPVGIAAQRGCNAATCSLYVVDTGNYSVKEILR